MSIVKESFVTLHKVKIDAMQGLCAGSYVYEGCNIVLRDGWMCALGKHKRRLRRKDPESPMGPHARGRSQHVCCIDGAGTYMWCFAVQIGDVTIQVNEELGMKLMGMSGEYFRAECDGRGDKIREVCARAMSGFWTILYVIEGRGVCRALSVVKTEEAGPSTSQDKVKGKAGTILKEKEPECRVDSGLRGRFRVTSRLQVDELGDNFSAELVTSLKSFRIKEEQ
ncbi:unnamed protein product [Calypogeia fissa]